MAANISKDAILEKSSQCKIEAQKAALITMADTNNASYNDSNTATTALDPYTMRFFDAWHFLSIYYLWPLWPLAMTANIIIIIVYFCTSLGTTKTTRMYYLVLAATEIGVMVFKDLFYFMFGYGFYAVGLDQLIPGGVYRWSVENLGGCTTVIYMWFAFEAYTNATYLVLGVERFIALYFPFKARGLITKRKMTIVMVCLAAGLFGYFSQFYYLERLQYGPYYLRGISCFMGGTSDTFYLVMSTSLYVFNQYFATFFTAVFSALIVIKIKLIMSSRSSVSFEGSKTMSAKQVDAYITPVIISSLHICFYIPPATLRTVATALPYVIKFTKLQALALNGLSFSWHIAIMPVHFVNFLVYCARVRGFWDNVKLCLTCRTTRLVKLADHAGHSL